MNAVPTRPRRAKLILDCILIGLAILAAILYGQPGKVSASIPLASTSDAIGASPLDAPSAATGSGVSQSEGPPALTALSDNDLMAMFGAENVMLFDVLFFNNLPFISR